jgi:hypothetical protein
MIKQIFIRLCFFLEQNSFNKANIVAFTSYVSKLH